MATKKAPKPTPITLLEAFQQITTIITELKQGDTTADVANDSLITLAGRVNAEIPGVSFKVPSIDELKTLEKEPEYESSYSDSNCW